MHVLPQHNYHPFIVVCRLQSPQAIEVIMATWQDYSFDFVHLKPQMEKVIYEEAKKRILVEYLKAILTRYGCHKGVILCSVMKMTVLISHKYASR